MNIESRKTTEESIQKFQSLCIDAKTGEVIRANQEVAQLFGCLNEAELKKEANFREVMFNQEGVATIDVRQEENPHFIAKELILIKQAIQANLKEINLLVIDEQKLNIFEKLADHAEGVVLSVIGDNYTYLAANQGHATLKEITKDAIIGRSVADIYGEEVFKAYIKPHLDIALAGKKHQYEFFNHENQTYKLTTMTPLMNKMGEVISVTVTTIDITARKEEEKQRLQIEQDKQTGYRELLIAMAEMAESRSPDTRNHLPRTAAYVEALARKMAKQYSFSAEEIELFRQATPFHDVGKMNIPDEILLKPGKLTKEEFEEIKKHTIYGADLATKGDYPVLEIASIIALHHHEKWNGQGYPNGLKGKEIPIIARIMAVVDVFDALTSKRSYKEAFSIEKAISILQADSGTHFDPEVVDAFLEILDEILEIKEQLPDTI